VKADHTLGTAQDDAVSTNATGTISGKLRGLVGLVVTLLSRLPASLGQKAKAASFPVTRASDEDALTVTASGTVTADQGAAGAAAWPTKDAGPAWTTVRGVSGEPVTSANMSGAAVAVTDAPTGTQKIVVDDLYLSTDTDLDFTLTEETSGTVILGPLYMAAKSAQQVTPRAKLKLDTADKKLFCQTSAAGNVSVLALYHSEA
jgi:hypothetical protein